MTDHPSNITINTKEWAEIDRIVKNYKGDSVAERVADMDEYVCTLSSLVNKTQELVEAINLLVKDFPGKTMAERVRGAVMEAKMFKVIYEDQKAIIDRLPKDAQGNPLVRGQQVWLLGGDGPYRYGFDLDDHVAVVEHPKITIEGGNLYRADCCYSTEQAARQAAEEASDE